VGHALHHDLRALKIDYQPVIDTSLLLAYKCVQDSLLAQLLKAQRASFLHFDDTRICIACPRPCLRCQVHRFCRLREGTRRPGNSRSTH